MILTLGMATVYTLDDLNQVKAAIMALATGQRAISVTFAGPPQRVVEYGSAQLGDLRALQAEIQREVFGSPTFRRVTVGKGFDPSRGNGGCD